MLINSMSAFSYLCSCYFNPSLEDNFFHQIFPRVREFFDYLLYLEKQKCLQLYANLTKYIPYSNIPQILSDELVVCSLKTIQG